MIAASGVLTDKKNTDGNAGYYYNENYDDYDYDY
jgi:hypothetical protein